jgi:hypothetical protein
MRPVCIVLPHADAGHHIRRLRGVQGAKTQTKIVILGDAGPELALAKERSRTNREQSGSCERSWTSFTDVLEIRNMKVGGLGCPAFLLFFCRILFTHFSPGYRDFVS